MILGIIFICIGIAVLYSYANDKKDWVTSKPTDESSQIYCEFSVFFQFAKTSLPIVGGDYYVIYSISSEY